MKPIKLTIEGVNSFSEKAEIDFRPLLKNGIFGIFGDTGSGKSSILDCIVLALYGTVERTAKNENFINVRRDRASVDFVFETTVDGAPAVYEAERTFSLGKDRKYKGGEAKLSRIEGGAKLPVADKARDVDAKIQEIVGLTQGDFQKCIALPQGEFASFVKATRADRLDIVGRLFSLEQYSQKIYDRAKRLEDRLSSECDKLSGRLAEKAEYTAEGLREKELAHERLEAEKAEAAKISAELRVRAREEARKAEKTHAFELAQADCAALEAEESNARARLAAAERSERAEGVIAADGRLAAAKKALAAACADYERAKAEAAGAAERAKRARETLGEDGYERRQAELAAEKAAVETSRIPAKSLEEKEKSLAAFRRDYKENESHIERARAEIARNAEEQERNRRELDALGEGKDFLAEAARLQIAGEVRAAHGRVSPLADGSAYARASEAEWDSLERSLGSLAAAGLSASGLAAALERREKAEKCGEELRAKESEWKGTLTALEKRKTDLTEKGRELARERDELAAELARTLGGKGYAEALADAERALGELAKRHKERADAAERTEKLSAATAQNLAAATASLSGAEQTARAASEALAAEIAGSGFADAEQARAGYLGREAREEARRQAKELGENLAARRAEREALRAESAGALPPAEFEKLLRDAADWERIFEEAAKNLGAIQESLKNYGQNLTEKCIIEKRFAEAEKKRRLAETLKDLVAGRKLMEYVAEEYLADVARSASGTLLGLSGGRYFLSYDKEFWVGDNYNGGERRLVATLSGGETFLVSLSLAVALSTAIYRKSLKPIEFFFLDEGFGTLDEGLIEVVLDSLEKLKNTHFAIGLISHVAELKHRIESKILVTGATADRGSSIQIIS